MYTRDEYRQMADEANAQSKKLQIVQETKEVPIYNDEGEIIGYETIVVDEHLEIVDNPENFARRFFNTSLGYVSREVHNLTGKPEDFINDTLPQLQEGIPIITYNADGSQNRDVNVTAEFIQECKQQKLKDFYGG